MAEAAIAAMTAVFLQQNQPFFCIWQTNPLTGELSQDVTQWFEHFEYHAGLISDLDDATKLTELKKSLNGRALTIFQSAPADEINTYVTAKQHLKINLAPLNQCALWQQEFHNRTKQETETIADYFRELQRLVNLAFEKEQDNAKKLVLKQKFINGLMIDNQSHPKYKLWKTAYKNMSDTLENIVAAVTTAESNQRLFTTTLSNRNDHADIQGVVSTYRKVYQPRSQYSRANQSPDQCIYCGFSGHDVTDCRHLQSAKQHAQSVSGTNRCNHCGKSGHFRQDCRLYAQAKARLGGSEPVTCCTQNNQQIRSQQFHNRGQRQVSFQSEHIDYIGDEYVIQEEGNNFLREGVIHPAHAVKETATPVDDLTPQRQREDNHRRQWKRKMPKNAQSNNAERNTTESFHKSCHTVPINRNSALNKSNENKKQNTKSRQTWRQRPRSQPGITNAHDRSKGEHAVQHDVKRSQRTLLNNIGTIMWSIIRVIFAIIYAPIKVVGVFFQRTAKRSSLRTSPCVEFVVNKGSIQVRAPDGSHISIVRRSQNQCIVQIWSSVVSSQEADDPLVISRQTPAKGKSSSFKVPRPTGQEAAESSPVCPREGVTQSDLSPAVFPGSWSSFPFSSLWPSGGSNSLMEETQETSFKMVTSSSPATSEDEQFHDQQLQSETSDVQGQEPMDGPEQEQVDEDFLAEDFDYPDVCIFDQPAVPVNENACKDMQPDPNASVLDRVVDKIQQQCQSEDQQQPTVSNGQVKSRKSKRGSKKANGRSGRSFPKTGRV